MMGEWIADNAVALIGFLLSGMLAWGKSRGEINGLGIRLDNTRELVTKQGREIAELEGELRTLERVSATMESVDRRLARIEQWFDRHANRRAE